MVSGQRWRKARTRDFSVKTEAERGAVSDMIPQAGWSFLTRSRGSIHP